MDDLKYIIQLPNHYTWGWNDNRRNINLWCEQNCQGKFYVSIFGYIRLELESDYVLAVLRFE